MGVTVALTAGVAFDEFYRQERTGVLRAVGFALNDRQLAVDAVDEAMARAYERWGEVGPMANPAGWVFRVAVNFGRNRQRHRLVELRKRMPPPSVSWPQDAADPAMARALARLPLEQRAVVVLRYHLDYSLAEVAVALGVAEGTVKSRLHRALRRLEELLEEKA